MSLHRPRAGEQANKKHCASTASSMIKGKQPVSEEEDEIDRISSLPRDVIDRILELMPTQDAVRTCVLSSKWRYIWANHPKLVLNKEFWDTIKQKRISKEFCLDFAIDTLNRMFINHIGHINEFVLDISDVRPARHRDVELWLSFLSRRGLQVLKIESSTATPYIVPSCVFSNSNLTDLSISSCILKTTKSFTSLHMLKHLNLENVTLSSCVLGTPLLSFLVLKSCRNTHHCIISAPRLVSLTILQNDYLNLVPYLTCTYIKRACICFNSKISHEGHGERINLMKLLTCWPKIFEFTLDGPSLEYLATGTIPGEFPFSLSLIQLLLCDIDFNLDQIAWILCILQKSPLLHRLDIRFLKNVRNDLEVANYLEESDFLNHRMEKLRQAKMDSFTASRVQLLLTKMLLRGAPLLERMLVEEDENLDLTERLRISKELMELPRASPNARIIFRPKRLAAAGSR